MAKVIEEVKSDIPVGEMKDGDVGIITEWGRTPNYCGRIVQRFDEKIISIGMDSGYSWNPIPQHDDFRVRILPKGTKIEL